MRMDLSNLAQSNYDHLSYRVRVVCEVGIQKNSILHRVNE